MQTTDSYENVDPGPFAAVGAGVIIFCVIIALFVIVSSWKIYAKAGKPGWACIVPIYGTIVLLEIVGKPAWWFLLLLIPFVNIVIAIIVIHRLSLSFGQGVGTTLLLLFIPIIGYPMLAFGSATYVGAPK